jgi:DNA repair protein RadC
MSHLDQEHLRTVLLDTKNRVQAICTVYIGSLNASMVRVGEIFKDTAGELGVSVLLSNRPYPPAPSLRNFTEIGWSDLAYRLRRHATHF